MVFTRKDGIFMGYVSFREGNRLSWNQCERCQLLQSFKPANSIKVGLQSMNDLGLLSPLKVLFWKGKSNPKGASRKGSKKSDSKNPHFFRAFQDNLRNICKIDLLLTAHFFVHTFESLQIDHSRCYTNMLAEKKNKLLFPIFGVRIIFRQKKSARPGE